MKYKTRIEKLEQRVPADDDDTIVIIRLAWGDEQSLENKPVSLRRGRGGHLIRRHGIDTIPAHLSGRAGGLGKLDDDETQDTNRA